MPTKGLYVNTDAGDGFNIRDDADLTSTNTQIDNLVFRAFYISAEAEENIPAYKAVYMSAPNKFKIADSQTIGKYPVEGITISATLPNFLAMAQRIGEITNPGWSWNIGDCLFLGTNGDLTSIAPSSGIVQQVATVKNATTILIELKQTIKRS